MYFGFSECAADTKPQICMCKKISKPVCGKDGKTYSNECVAKCAKVEIQMHTVCPVNTEAVKVWAAALSNNAAMSKWQQGWKADARTPLYSLTKKKAGVPHTEYTFKFANKCSAVVLFSNSDGKAKLGSGSCAGTDECMDHDAKVKEIIKTSNVLKALLSSIKLSSSQYRYELLQRYSITAQALGLC